MSGSTQVSGRRLRLALGAPDGARRGPRPAGGWPVLDGRVVGAVQGPFLGLEGPGFEKAWYLVALDAPLPAGFDPFHTLDAHAPTAPVGRVLLRPDLVEPPPPDEIQALPADLIGAALEAEGRARVSVYVGLDAGAVPARLSLSALKAGPIRWLCAAWTEFLPNCS